jgi:hypothetical protein
MEKKVVEWNNHRSLGEIWRNFFKTKALSQVLLARGTLESLNFPYGTFSEEIFETQHESFKNPWRIYKSFTAHLNIFRVTLVRRGT